MGITKAMLMEDAEDERQEYIKELRAMYPDFDELDDDDLIAFHEGDHD